MQLSGCAIKPEMKLALYRVWYFQVIRKWLFMVNPKWLFQLGSNTSTIYTNEGIAWFFISSINVDEYHQGDFRIITVGITPSSDTVLLSR